MKLSFPSAYTILIFISIVVAAATWILPAGSYKYQEADGTVVSHDQASRSARPIPGSYGHVEQNPQGLYAVASAPIMGFYSTTDVIVFILVIGGFINVAVCTGAINAGIQSLIKKLHGREKLMIPILMIFFSLGGTVYAMGEEAVALCPIVIAVMMASGYDKITGLAIVLIGTHVGALGSTINPFGPGVASGVLGISIADGMLLRVVLLIAVTILGILYVMRYASKVKANPKYSIVFASHEEDVKHFLGEDIEQKIKHTGMTGIQKIVLAIFGFSFGMMIFSMIPFDKVGLSFIPTLNWWLDELSTLFFVASIVMGIVARMSEKQIVGNFITGIEKIAGVAILVGVARGIKVLMEQGLIAGTILNYGEVAVSGLSSYTFIIGAFFVEGCLATMITSYSGLAAFSIPIIGPIATFANVEPSLVITAYHSALSTVRLISPSAPVMMAMLAISTVRYDKWIKFVIPLIPFLVLSSLLVLMFGVYIG